jgi:predicted CXXCH cytochrome family protein
MVHHLETHGLTAEYPVAYAVGAGEVGFSYLISIPPFMFQSPASYYSQARTWDVTPGYEPERLLDFTHPITAGCVFCHAGTINLAPGTDNQFRAPALTPISCERCHGPSRPHLQNPVPGSIVNPARLAPKLRAAVCEQCHLEGEARILNPGKTWQDFQPGAATESVFVTYVRQLDRQDGIKAVSQVEQLALSRCARESGDRLWCGTCHNPHRTADNRGQEIREICLSCHASTFARGHKPAQECVSCHMPRIRPTNVAHAAITSHVISIPHSEKMPVHHSRTSDLSAWREPDPGMAERDLGLALFQTGAAARNWSQLGRSYDILSHLRQRDSEVLATLGSLLLEQDHLQLAVDFFEQALALEPGNARFLYELGVALASQSQLEPAIAALRRSIEIDPSAPEAYRELEKVYDTEGRKDLGQRVVQEYLRFMPQNLSFRREP